jgi:hypothetical protein
MVVEIEKSEEELKANVDEVRNNLMDNLTEKQGQITFITGVSLAYWLLLGAMEATIMFMKDKIDALALATEELSSAGVGKVPNQQIK